MLPMPVKKSKRNFGKGGKKPTINNPDTHHGTYDLPNASVRSYSDKAKPMKFAKGGSFAEEFNKARAKGAGTVFDWNGKKIAAYRKGEEPESWKRGKGKEEPKKEAPKSESKAPSPRPTTQEETNRNQAAAALESARMIAANNEREENARREAAMSPEEKYNKTVGESVAAYGRRQQAASSPNMAAAKQFSKLASQGGPMAEYYAQQAKKFSGEAFAKGGAVDKKYSAMEKRHASWMASHGAPKSMVAEERKEASEGMACGGKVMKYARGGGIESKGKTKGTMIKMASGGSVSARADGIAKKGKTNCKMR